MTRGFKTLGLLAVGVALAVGGCESKPTEDKAGTTPQPAASSQILAVQPINLSRDVGRRPVFAWQLPSSMRNPQYVTFKLFEVGPALNRPEGAKPDATFDTEPGEQEVLVVINLARSSPGGVDIFAPPVEAIRTGELRDKGEVQLKPNTWYHWKVEAVDSSGHQLGSFYFLTMSQPVTVAPPVEPKIDLALPPMPEPLPPEPIDTRGGAPKAPAK